MLNKIERSKDYKEIAKNYNIVNFGERTNNNNAMYCTELKEYVGKFF